MSANTASLTSHVAHLRRFARALTGSQVIGDNYVLLALEAATSKRMEPAFGCQVAAKSWLYRALLEVWREAVRNGDALMREVNQETSPVDFNLTAVTPMARAAFLLQSMEQFDLTQMALILQQTVPEVEWLIDRAGAELATQISTDVLIVEDEPYVSTDLRMLVEQLGHRVPHIARTHQEAVTFAFQCHPGLVLADVHLAGDSSGIAAVNDIVTVYDVPVVFITGYPEEFGSVEPPGPPFFVTKPYRRAAVKAVISQALFFGVRAPRPHSAI